MKYEFIDGERSRHAVEKMCLLLRVSRSGYYAYCRQGKGARLKSNGRILDEIKKSYMAGRGAYGSPRITMDLRERGLLCGKNRVPTISGEDQ